MASIKIYGDQNKGCIFFENSTVEPKFLGTIIARVKTDETDRIVIDRTDRYRRDGVTFRTVFRRLKATRVQNQAGENLVDDLGMSTADVVTYINQQASNYFAGGAIRPELDEHPNFILDATHTTIMVDNGENFGVNTLKAILGEDGLIDIVSADHSDNAVVHYEDCPHANLQINGSFISGGPNDVVNALNELFTVGAFESVVVNDPYATLLADVQGTETTWNRLGDMSEDPDGADLVGATGNNTNRAGVRTVDTINQPGEYFTFDLRRKCTYGMGLINVNDTDGVGQEDTFCDGSGSYAQGYQWSQWLHSSHGYAWTLYGERSGYSMKSGWSQFIGSDEHTALLADGNVKFRVGVDENSFIHCDYYDSSESSWVRFSQSSYPVAEGSEFALGVKIGTAQGRLFSAPKVHLRATEDTPTTVSDSNITVFGTDVSGDLASGIVYSGNNDDDNNGFVTAETLTQSGEYFEFTWTDGDANFGLFSENDHAVGDLDADRTQWGNDDYIFFGARSEQNGTVNGLYNENNYATTVLESAIGSYYGRVGFDTSGRATVWASTDGVNYTVKQRINAAAPEGNYRFVWVAQDANANLSTLTKGQLSTAPTMYFRYIESGDGNFHYPLFATEEEAKYYHKVTTGHADGVSHTHVYPDDPTNTTWYMPDNGEMAGVSAPSSLVFDGQTSLYTEITSLTDADLAPPAFTGSDLTFAEDAVVNIQVSPQDVSYTTSVSGLPGGLSFSGGYLISGTTRHVYGDETHTVLVTRTNSYGSSQGSFDLTITDDVSQNSLSGLTIYGQDPITQSPDVIHHYSGPVNLDLDLTLNPGTEIIWTQQNEANNQPGGPGQYLQIGIADPGVDKMTTPLGNNTSDWQLKATMWTATLNHMHATGWTDNSQNSTGSNDNIEWKLSFPTDNGPIELYREGVLIATSSASYSGNQTVTAGVPGAYVINTRMPSFTRADITFAGDPPAGFTQEHGTMDSPTTLSSDSVVNLDQVLPSGKRLLVNKSWIETNVLPYCTDGLQKAYIGVPAVSPAWASVNLHTDFDAVMRWEGQSSDAHKTTIADGSDIVARHESNIGSATNAHYHYAIEWDGTNLVVLRDTDISKFSNEHDYTQFQSYSAYENYTARSGDLPLVMATKTGGTMTLSMSGISVVDIPAAPVTNLTPWSYALDFSGSSERAMQVSTSSAVNPMMMNGLSVTTADPLSAGDSSSDSNARPWATACVFQYDGHSSNQHIWNQGEGVGGDNVYLRMSAAGYVYFGWGRDGSGINECVIGGALDTAKWWGVYVAHNGTRLSGSNATAANLADCFDIYLMRLNDAGTEWVTKIGTPTDAEGNRSIESNWHQTGYRMDRSNVGGLTLGGRGANRSFHGKIASMVVTTLRRSYTMPTKAEAEMMITDPKQWEDVYRVGQTVRGGSSGGDSAYQPANIVSGYGATQMWLMGDGQYDNYSNMIRNQVYPQEQNYTKMNLISMVSNDIQNVTIPGLS